jgi:hypothetical protein
VVANIFAGDLVVERECRRWKPSRTLLSRWNQFASHSFVVESTTLADWPCEITSTAIAGVQVHGLADWLARYDGDVYAICPVVPLTYDESHRLSERLLDAVGIEYDTPGAGIAGLRWLDRWLPCSRDRRRYYCAELVADALVYAHGIPASTGINPGEMSPVDLVRYLVRSGNYAEPVLVSR